MNTYMKIRVHTRGPALHSHLRCQKRDGSIFIIPHPSGPKGDHVQAWVSMGTLGLLSYKCSLFTAASSALAAPSPWTGEGWSQGADDFSGCTFLSRVITDCQSTI